MKHFFSDFHVHIGKTTEGNSVKITASKELTFPSIIEECYSKKGIDIVGVVDCASPGVIKDIERMIRKGDLYELEDGGLIHKDKVMVILGSEIECVEDNGAVSHHVGYFPFVRQLKEFSRIMKGHIRNIELSSQSSGMPAYEFLSIVKATGGILMPAHVFTPHKSVYGRAARRMKDLFLDNQQEDLYVAELGLSADTYIADRIDELKNIVFLSNSDAHSAGKIGREYNILELSSASFKEISMAFRNNAARRVIANYGIDPRLGRYHRSFCRKCNKIAEKVPPVLSCDSCGTSDRNFIKGVLDRVTEIEDSSYPRHPGMRPPYYYQVPLEYVPGLTKKMLERLFFHFGSEMAVLHTAEKKEIQEIVGWRIASDIILAREGKLKMSSGGGGKYGKVKGILSENEQLEFELIES